ncbi:MAG: AAA family ATPase, partial [Bacteroidia bacterium]|nr:AAA family ATPase [Bacteroidia bacterium]
NQNNYKFIVSQLNDVRLSLHKVQEKVKYLHQEIQKTQTRFNEVSLQKAQLEPIMSRLSSRMNELSYQKEKVDQELEALRVRVRGKLQEKEELISMVNRLEVRQMELFQQEAILRQRASAELGSTVEILPAIPSPRLKTNEVEKRLEELRDALNALGDLNFEAASSLHALRLREKELMSEKADIENALKQLKSLIYKLDQEAQKRFLQAFAQVRERFIKIFQSLFDEGDSCDLALVQPESPLSSEIEIIARPKGKRPLSLQQLSSGEKTLVALALLFAILAVKPSALCVMDEVDAPLDDVNAHKFGQLLKNFADKTTLIVITHNKITMSYCDFLLGVTMAEAGVSLVIGVEARNKTQEAALVSGVG